MKAYELRIGNIVMRREFLPRNLDNCRFDEIVVTHNDITACSVSENNFKFILITEEWLLNFGFESNAYQDRYEKGPIHIECDKTKGETFLWIENMPHIKYVHQLQNLHFALTGMELIIRNK